MRAADVMTTNICVAAPEAPIQDIAREMLDRRISGVPVVDDDDHVWGHVESPEQRRAILLAAESIAGDRPVVDHMVDWRVPGYV